MNDSFTLFIVFGERPGADALRVTRAEARTTICVEDVARAGFVKHRPDFKTLTEFPASPVKHSPTAGELRRLALIARALGQGVECLLARHFKPDCLKRYVHKNPVTSDK
jgi:hypothetical protein